MKMESFVRAASAALLALSLAPSAQGEQLVYWAAPDGTEDAACTEEAPGTIAAALAKCVARDTAADGDVVRLKDGDYPFTDALTVSTKNVIIEAQNRHQAVLIGGRETGTSLFALDVMQNAKLDGLVFTNFYINAQTEVGAVRVQGGTLTVDNCRFIDNRGPDGGELPINSGSAIAVAAGRAVISNCYFKRNACKGHWQDQSGGGGALVFYRGQSSVVYDSVFEENSCLGNSQQGGAGLWGTYYRCTFRGNTAGTGMALWSAKAYDCIFEDHIGEEAAVLKGCTASNCVIRGTQGNQIVYGGTLTDCVVTNNLGTQATGWDRAFFRDCTLKNCLVQDNIYTSGNWVKRIGWNANFRNCLVVSNGAAHANFFYQNGSLVNCTLVDNYACDAAKTPLNIADCVSTNTAFVGQTLTGGTHVNAAYTSATESDSLVLENSILLADRDAFKLRPATSSAGHIYAPKGGSPLIDAGVVFEDLDSYDFLGQARLAGSSVDIGAMEYRLTGFWLMLR
ncbi:MAG: right-handed parallel beta-helix repeat-containing protein [Kiritimatiellia bacterium]